MFLLQNLAMIAAVVIIGLAAAGLFLAFTGGLFFVLAGKTMMAAKAFMAASVKSKVIATLGLVAWGVVVYRMFKAHDLPQVHSEDSKPVGAENIEDSNAQQRCFQSASNLLGSKPESSNKVLTL